MQKRGTIETEKKRPQKRCQKTSINGEKVKKTKKKGPKKFVKKGQEKFKKKRKIKLENTKGEKNTKKKGFWKTGRNFRRNEVVNDFWISKCRRKCLQLNLGYSRNMVVNVKSAKISFILARTSIPVQGDKKHQKKRQIKQRKNPTKS